MYTYIHIYVNMYIHIYYGIDAEIVGLYKKRPLQQFLGFPTARVRHLPGGVVEERTLATR